MYIIGTFSFVCVCLSVFGGLETSEICVVLVVHAEFLFDNSESTRAATFGVVHAISTFCSCVLFFFYLGRTYYVFPQKLVQ